MFRVSLLLICSFSFLWCGDHRDLHVLTHSFPTRRSSDLQALVSAYSAISRMRASAGVLCRSMVDLSIGASGSFEVTRSAIGSSKPESRSAATRSEENTSELQSLMRIS